MKKTSRNILAQTMANHYQSSPRRTNGSNSGNGGNCHKVNGSENNNQAGEIGTGNGIGHGNGCGKVFTDADILVKSGAEPGKTGGDAAPLMPAKNNTTATTAVAGKTNNHHNNIINHNSNNNNHNNNNNLNRAMKGGPSEENLERKSEWN